MSSLERLIELAKRTGDTLIVHQPERDQDMVILGVDRYEQLYTVSTGNRKELSERQLLDQINRDIALWRAHQEMEDTTDFPDEEEMEDEPEDSYPDFLQTASSPWHSTGNILSDRFSEPRHSYIEDIEDLEGIGGVDSLESMGIEDDELISEDSDLHEFDMVNESLSEKVSEQKNDTIDEPKTVPYQAEPGAEAEGQPLDDDQVFYVEPV